VKPGTIVRLKPYEVLRDLYDQHNISEMFVGYYDEDDKFDELYGKDLVIIPCPDSEDLWIAEGGGAYFDEWEFVEVNHQWLNSIKGEG